MPGLGVLVVLALAVSRVTGLIVADEITRPGREAILRRLDENRPVHQMLAYLISCAWCAGIYVGVGGALAAWRWFGLDAEYVPVAALAFAWVAGATSNLGRGE